MIVYFELIIPRRPVSAQTRRRQTYHDWIAEIRRQVTSAYGAGIAPFTEEVHVEIVTFYNEIAIDVDNVVKPILDGLSGIVYAEDGLVETVISRRTRVGNLPPLVDPKLPHADRSLADECVYIRVSRAAVDEGEA